jgi:hypothetical protein
MSRSLTDTLLPSPSRLFSCDGHQRHRRGCARAHRSRRHTALPHPLSQRQQRVQVHVGSDGVVRHRALRLRQAVSDGASEARVSDVHVRAGWGRRCTKQAIRRAVRTATVTVRGKGAATATAIHVEAGTQRDTAAPADVERRTRHTATLTPTHQRETAQAQGPQQRAPPARLSALARGPESWPARERTPHRCARPCREGRCQRPRAASGRHQPHAPPARGGTASPSHHGDVSTRAIKQCTSAAADRRLERAAAPQRRARRRGKREPCGRGATQ